MSDLIKDKIFVIMPAYNEQAIILSVLKELLPYNYTIVIVDDGSVPPLLEYIKQFPVYLLRHEINLGQGAALQTGINFAIANDSDYIITFDADGQHNASDIDRLLNALVQKKTDIALGSRFLERPALNIPYQRKLLLQSARLVNFLFTGLLLTDAHNGLRALTNKAAKKIYLSENRMAHATELLSQIKKHNLLYTEVPVTINYTDYSKSKGQTTWDGFKIISDLFFKKLSK